MTTAPPSVLPHRWLVLAALVTVLLMTPLDGSAVNIILPVLQREFHASVSVVAWVPLIYLVIIASLLLPVGRLGDLWGFRRIFLAGVALFTFASALCGFAPNLGWLIAARTLQGIGATMMMALSSGIAAAIFPPHERGRALGTVGMGIAFGLVLGPALGGFLTDALGWRWIFFINLPIGLLGGLWVWRVLPPLTAGIRHKLDGLGAALGMCALGTLMLAITHGEEWGWRSPVVLGLLAVALLAGILFVRQECVHPEPMLDLRLFRNPVFAGANIASMVNFLGQFTALFLTPKLLQDGLSLTTKQAGLAMGALPVGVLILAPISGAFSDRLGTRLPAVVGQSLVTLGLLLLALVLPRERLAEIIFALVLVGIGTGIFQSPNNSAVMGSVPRTHLGIGGGVLAIMRNLGMSFGIAISSAVLLFGTQHAGTPAPHDTLIAGIRLAFFVGAGFTGLGVLTSALRGDHR